MNQLLQNKIQKGGAEGLGKASFLSPTNRAQGSFSSTSSPMLALSCGFDFSHKIKCEGIPHYSSDLHFPDGKGG